MGRHSARGPRPRDGRSGVPGPRPAPPGPRPAAPGGYGETFPQAATAPATGEGAPRVAPAPADTPAHGVPYADGTPARGVPRVGAPRSRGPAEPATTPPHGTPAHDGTATGGGPGGHPEQREPGGWGALGGSPRRWVGRGADGRNVAGRGAAGADPADAGRVPVRGGVPGPRREYLEAFDGPNAGEAGDADTGRGRRGPAAGAGVPSAREAVAGTEDRQESGTPAREPAGEGTDPAAGGSASAGDDTGRPGRGRAGRAAPPAGGRGRTFTGIAAAAVTTVLAIVVAGQVTADPQDADTAQPGGATERTGGGEASRSDGRPTPAPPPPPPSYEEKLATKYPLDPKLKGPGKFTTVPGGDKAPGRGEVVRYRVDVESELPLEAELFAKAVHKTLNDERSWGRGGQRTFERVSSGSARFVISLASPGTTATWCAKSGLDITQDNVSCDSAATERIMINAYRWAQGAKTFRDDQTTVYRQMLINHEVGHRLGRDHEGCPSDGALAPVMMQQTKLLHTDDATCRVNAWPYPDGAKDKRGR
ncbi:DUF3152 domain-containing protein [Streptomyces sp. 71268]|uniref:DUF3152 domain-containing protein n=1 Tax=Streptomyces sp. 71268 TaxID=3002640 RepID=UPI0023F8B207|nr:DUF3152 domain-containing protein [Streptomyces sp. 71268]WEV25518.1 DUF3152 domain-containing protein [Streptomyces sp. 71268]